MTRTRLVAIAITTGLFLTGCAGGPSKVGAAAIIGNTSIPVDTVQQRFEAWLKAYPDGAAQLRGEGRLGELGRAMASVLISRDLVRQVAQQEGVTYSEEQVNQLVEQAGGSQQAAASTLETPANYRESVRAQLLSVGIGRKYIDKLRVNVDYTNAATYTEAQTKAKTMAESEAASAELVRKDAAALGGQGGAAERVNRPFTAADLLQNPQSLAPLALFTAKPGTVVAFSLNQGEQSGSGQWVVARIKTRSAETVEGTPAGGLAERANLNALEALGQAVVSYYAAGMDVQVNPRYGVWVPTAAHVQGRLADPKVPSPFGFSIPARASVKQ
ncbi:NADH dehydrogenase/NADH:ubiquinone oxidoreductase subunit G [Crossiella equi]|uniref:NADH dehydrogenase/NADH:ubiquinone oxidoreductase subunit G n=1 Tax=Crossiella equi TaxID=130796 RepID=A0ABS5AIB5_9PSEU|nr:SurA N-terminal domain-containing protein [Crossiella equi]MBP2476313.1 NADH dehydrogenase/NADH:ubiquinone oxidoreductase subunit G [Crossiella equi]